MKSLRFFVLLFVVANLCSTSRGQIPRTLSYQGVLTDSLGNPKPDGTYSFTFRLYESVSGGSPIWTEQKILSVSRGLFYTALGDQVILGSSVTFDRPYWLGIQVVSAPELSPRMPLTASAYSITSIRSDTARFALTAPQQGFVDSARIAGTIPNNTVTTAKIVDGAITSAKIGSGQVVRRVNGIADGITIAAQGGATITSSNDTIIINAGSGGGGTGVQGVQNTNNTLDVINPNGPTVTVNVKNSGIATTQIADNSVTSAKIIDGTIQFADVGQNGAASGQVVKWSGTAWQPSTDNIGTGVFLPLNGGTITGAITSTGSPSITMGKGNFGSGNTNAGSYSFVAGQNNISSAYVASVAGGSNNSATLDYASVGGGTSNLASATSAHVGGGDGNTASGNTSIVSGGLGNNATAQSSTIGGGENNTATAFGSTIGGGRQNRARGLYSVVSGGGGASLTDSNSAGGIYSTISGGSRNRASYGISTVSGGWNNAALADYATVGGGHSNDAIGNGSTISGGTNNNAIGNGSTISGGANNEADGRASTIGGGSYNRSRGEGSVVGGGGGPSPIDSNSAGGTYSTISGGRQHIASGFFTAIGGGSHNAADGQGATVGGGINNKARGTGSVVSGGGSLFPADSNSALGDYSTIGGGRGNIASGYGATVSGGERNVASGHLATVIGGSNAAARDLNSLAFGYAARANHQSSVVIKASSNSDSTASGINDQMVLMAENNFYITNTTGVAPSSAQRLINTSSGAYLTTGGTWTNSSDRNLKENLTPVDRRWVLSKVAELPITMWNYRAESRDAKHIGPTAQDFYALFGVGSDDKSISTVDPAGIALVAIQQLALENQALRSEMEELRTLVKFMASSKEEGGK